MWPIHEHKNEVLQARAAFLLIAITALLYLPIVNVRHQWPGMAIPPTVIRRKNYTIMVTVTRHRESFCRLSPSLDAGTPFRIKRWGDEPRKHQHPALLLSSTLSTLSSPLNHLPFINLHHDVFWKALHHRRCCLRHRGQWIPRRGQWIPRQWQWIPHQWQCIPRQQQWRERRVPASTSSLMSTSTRVKSRY
jgi:hypothetical protein